MVLYHGFISYLQITNVYDVSGKEEKIWNYNKNIKVWVAFVDFHNSWLIIFYILKFS